MKQPRIWVPPTQLEKISTNFKIKIPGKRTKVFIFQELAWFTELFLILIKKSLTENWYVER